MTARPQHSYELRSHRRPAMGRAPGHQHIQARRPASQTANQSIGHPANTRRSPASRDRTAAEAICASNHTPTGRTWPSWLHRAGCAVPPRFPPASGLFYPGEGFLRIAIITRRSGIDDIAGLGGSAMAESGTLLLAMQTWLPRSSGSAASPQASDCNDQHRSRSI